MGKSCLMGGCRAIAAGIQTACGVACAAPTATFTSSAMAMDRLAALRVSFFSFLLPGLALTPFEGPATAGPRPEQL